MRTLFHSVLVAGLGAGLVSAASAQDVLSLSSVLDSAAAHPRGSVVIGEPMQPRPRNDAGGFYSGRSAAVPNRNAIGQGVGRD